MDDTYRDEYSQGKTQHLTGVFLLLLLLLLLCVVEKNNNVVSAQIHDFGIKSNGNRASFVMSCSAGTLLEDGARS